MNPNSTQPLTHPWHNGDTTHGPTVENFVWLADTKAHWCNALEFNQLWLTAESTSSPAWPALAQQMIKPHQPILNQHKECTSVPYIVLTSEPTLSCWTKLWFYSSVSWDFATIGPAMVSECSVDNEPLSPCQCRW